MDIKLIVHYFIIGLSLFKNS